MSLILLTILEIVHKEKKKKTKTKHCKVLSAVSVAQVRHVIYKIALPWQTLSILHLL